VALVLARVDALIGIEQLNIENSRVLASHRNGPGVSKGNVVRDMLGVEDGQPANRAVGIQCKERLSFFVPAARGHK
jgi:hypothetical protein